MPGTHDLIHLILLIPLSICKLERCVYNPVKTHICLQVYRLEPILR